MERTTLPHVPRLTLDLLDLQLAASIRGDLDEAWRISEILAKERPSDDRAAFNRGWHMFRFGKFQEGMALTERGRSEGVFGSKPPKTTKPRWSGEDLRGKTILLRGEGGFGDEIISARFAQMLAARGARVVASASAGIVPLIARAKGVSKAIARGPQEEQEAFDYWVPGMSVPIPLGIEYDTIPSDPYMSADPTYVAKWRGILSSPQYKVGIRWSGSPKFEHEQHRRFPTEPLFALRTIPGVQLYSLQRDNDLRDLPEGIVDLQDTIETWEDTAAAIANLDLVITSCTSVAHVAAAMGKETWIIIPVLPYYVWALPGERSPWYKSVRLFRQTVFGNWDAPLAAVRAALEERMQGTPMTQPPLTTPVNTPSKTPRESLLVSYAVAGVYIAPAPARPAHAPTRALHFVGGLPRCGARALMALMSQNPRVASAPDSGLSRLVMGVQHNWQEGDLRAKKRVLRSLLEAYHDPTHPLVLDRGEEWPVLIPVLEAVLERPVKMLVPVRPLTEILTSYEALYRADPLGGGTDFLRAHGTIAARAAYLTGEGPVGKAFNALKDAVTAGYLDRMLFVDYNKLTAAPKRELKRIYEFLEEPYYEHDLSAVPQMPGVRSVFAKEFKPPRHMLGDMYNLYDHPEPWKSWI